MEERSWWEQSLTWQIVQILTTPVSRKIVPDRLLSTQHPQFHVQSRSSLHHFGKRNVAVRTNSFCLEHNAVNHEQNEETVTCGDEIPGGTVQKCLFLSPESALWSRFDSHGFPVPPLASKSFLAFFTASACSPCLYLLEKNTKYHVWFNSGWLDEGYEDGRHSFTFFGENSETIDYRCQDGRFPVSSNCMTITNPDELPKIETGVNPRIRSWRSTYLNELDVRKPLVVSI